MHRVFCKIAAAVFLAAVASAFPSLGLAQTITFPKKAVNFLTGGSGPRSVAVGDFNRDGKLDVAIANSTSKTVTVLLGNGDGTFQPAVTVLGPPTITTAPVFLVAADFDGDGKLDLAVVNGFDSNVYLLLGDGSGGFPNTNVLSGVLEVASSSHSIAVGDFNGDGKPDLAVTNSSGASGAGKKLDLILSNGLGGFTHSSEVLTAPAESVATADFDGDGNLDLAIADNNTVFILRGLGDGSFETPVDIVEAQQPRFVTVGDFNGDGIPDLAIGTGTNKNIAIRLGTGHLGDLNKGFLGDSKINVANIPNFILLGDFNGDGKLDVAVTFGSSPQVTIRPGNGDGTFAGALNVAIQRGSLSAVAGDFDGDGRPDIVAVNTIGTTVSLLLNTTAFAFAGDLGGKTDFPVTTNQISFPATDPTSIAAGDFNNDGKLDLAVANFGTNNVSVFLGGDAGTFTLTSQSPFDSGTGAAAVAAADFNRDGVLDLAVANSGAGTVSIFTGSISPDHTAYTATLTATLAVGNDPIAIAIGDFDGDGKVDIAVVNHDDDTVSILLGNGDGTFGPQQTFATATGPRGIAVGDFNRDGNLDLAVADETADKVSILLGVGDGTFGAKTDSNVGTSPVAVAAGDFNRDGKLDLAVANSGSKDVSILLGNGNGTFNAAVDFPIAGIAPTPSGIVIGDFNRDGRLDLAVTNSGEDKVSILLGDGAGSFDETFFTSPFTTGDNPVALVAGDFDRDGRLDVAVANQDGNNVSILLNTAPPPTVIAPTSSDAWPLLSVQTIRWSFNGGGSTVNILLSRNAGATFKAVIKKTPNDGSQNWTVTGPATAVNGAVIRICSTVKGGPCTDSDPFTIGP